jgi:hypothetical protein
MTILTLLQQILGPYKKFSNGENYFMCPFCHHPKKKFAINENNLKWHCWHCNSRGGHIIWLLKNLNLTKQQIQQFKELISDLDFKVYKTTIAESKLFLPLEFKPLWKPVKSYPYLHAVSYLKTRGIRTEDILRYRMGYCETGTYAGRIIVPSYDENNQLNYFTARSFYETGMKYKNPPVTKNIVCFENFVNWNEPIVLCEGMFDAIALRRNAIPLLGKTLPKKLEQALIKNKVKELVIFLDNDAKNDALNLERKLQQYNIDVRLVTTEEKDASDMGFEKSWSMIETAKSTNFKEFIAQKIMSA